MTDVSFAIEAKSDQLNAVDLAAGNKIITVRDVKVLKTKDQPIHIFYEGDNNKPWKPSLGMRVVLAKCWGLDSSQWVGKSAELYFDPEVTWAGSKVGGIRIEALSDITESGMEVLLNKNRSQRITHFVKLLKKAVGISVSEKKDTAIRNNEIKQLKMYPPNQFETALPKMKEMIADGVMTVEQVIARCEQTGKLTEEQIDRLSQ